MNCSKKEATLLKEPHIGEHLCQSLYFNKAAALRPATLLKKRLWHWCFPVEFVKFLRTPFLTEHLQWLLLRVPNFVSVPQFVLSRAPQIPWKKHTSEHLFDRGVPSGCFQMSVIFLKKGKTKTMLLLPLSLIHLKAYHFMFAFSFNVYILL